MARRALKHRKWWVVLMAGTVAVPAAAVGPATADEGSTVVGVAMAIVRLGGASYVDGACARFKSGQIAGAVGVFENDTCDPVYFVKAGGPATVIIEEANVALRHPEGELPGQGPCTVRAEVGTAEAATLSIYQYPNAQGLATYYGAPSTVMTVPELLRGEDVSGQVSFTCPDAPVVEASFQVRHLPMASDSNLRGVTINESANATNSRAVTLHPTWLEDDFFDAVMISNDGGFPMGDRVIRPLTSQPLEWTLAATDGQIMPKMVYLRFRDIRTGRWSDTVVDDIVLDTVAPEIVDVSVRTARASQQHRAASGRTVWVKVATLPDRTGIAVLQWRSPGHAPRLRRYESGRQRITVLGNVDRLAVRVRDGAGNWSRWMPAR